MKRFGAVILIIALCLLSIFPAMAEQTFVQGRMIVNNDALAAYTDENGFIFLPGNPNPINRDESGVMLNPAESILSVDVYRLIFYTSREDGGRDLMQIDLENFNESLLAEDVYTACLADEDTLYYVHQSDRFALMRMNMMDGVSSLAYTANEPIDRLWLSAEGLVLQLVDQAGSMVYIAETNTFEPYSGEIPVQNLLTDEYELGLSDAGDLYLKNIGSYASEHIDSGVLAFTRMNGGIYYLTHTGSAIRLKCYDPEAMSWQVVLTPEMNIENQLVASANMLFMLSSDHDIYSIDIEQGLMNLYKSYSDISAHEIPEGFILNGIEISAMSGQLNVYAVLEEASSVPDFSFIEFESVSENTPVQKRMLWDSIAIEGEETAWDLLKPAAQYTPLSRGSRGNAVRAIQQPLLNLGYYDYIVDGIFGPRTQHAIQLLQSDLNLEITGIADEELQRTILSGQLGPYDPYIPLNRGSKGLRTKIMQERLRELGYLADAADGIYGGRTHKAVQLFQSENGLPASDGATRNTLITLYSDGANHCSSYIDLFEGDTGYRVRELNNRLKALYYLDSNIGSTYTSQTAAAIRMFQREAGLAETGEATQTVQQALFSNTAPEAPGYILLKRGDENNRVVNLQNRLKALNYFAGRATGYYGSATQKAVALFQSKVGLKSTGIANIRTQELLFAPDAPVYVKPTVLGVPEIILDYYSHRENGVFLIRDDSSPTGQINFSWDAEGDVKSYNIRITDEAGNIYVSNDTLLTRTGVSISTLSYDRVYTLQVTAYPADGDAKHVTASSLSFARIETPAEPDPEEIGQVSTPVISVETIDYVQDGINYLQPGTVTFKWSADGQVASYYVDIQDMSNESLLDVNTTDQQASIRSVYMAEGEIYTIFVYAIPVNGTIENARMSSLRFALPEIYIPTQAPEATPTQAPAPSEDPGIELLPPPVLGFEPVAEVIGDISYVAGDEISLKWKSEGSVSEYYVEILNSANGVIAYTTTKEETLTIKAWNMHTDEVYTLRAVAIPVGGTIENGVSSTAKFALVKNEEESGSTAEGSAEPTATPVADPTSAPPTEPSDVPTEDSTSEPSSPATEEPAQEPTAAPVETPKPTVAAISAPVLDIKPIVVVENNISYVSGERIQFKWKSEGSVSAYYVDIKNSIEGVIAGTSTTEETLSILSGNLIPGELYELFVTAIPDGGTFDDGVSSSMEFALYVEPTPETVVESTPEPIAIGIPEPTAEPTAVPTPEPTAIPTAVPTPEPTAVPTAVPTPEPTAVPEVNTSDSIWNVPVDHSTAPDLVQQIQDRLVEWGWLADEGYAFGQLDESTIQAVLAFQTDYNANHGGALVVIDPVNPIIDVDTLSILMNQNDIIYPNPSL